MYNIFNKFWSKGLLFRVYVAILFYCLIDFSKNKKYDNT